MGVKLSTPQVVLLGCFPIGVFVYSLGFNIIFSPIIGTAYFIVGSISGDSKKYKTAKKWWISAIPIIGPVCALSNNEN
jgi:hypothetical protein